MTGDRTHSTSRKPADQRTPDTLQPDSLEHEAPLPSLAQQIRLDPRLLTPDGILQLQRTVGNAVVQRLFSFHTHERPSVQKQTTTTSESRQKTGRVNTQNNKTPDSLDKPLVQNRFEANLSHIQRLPLQIQVKGQRVIIDTDDFEAFKVRVMQYEQERNTEALTDLHEQLVFAIGWDQPQRVRHQRHFRLLQDSLASAEASRGLLDIVHKEQQEKETKAKAKEQQKVLEQQKRLQQKYSQIPSTKWKSIFSDPTLQEEASLDVMVLIYKGSTQKADSNSWFSLICDGIRRSSPLAGLRAMLQCTTLTLLDCQHIIGAYAQRCTAASVTTADSAIADKGTAPGKVPNRCSDNQLFSYIFSAGAELKHLQLLSYAPNVGKPSLDKLIKLIVENGYNQTDLELLDALHHVPFDVCTSCIAKLRLISLPRCAQVNQACQQVIAGGTVITTAILDRMLQFILDGVSADVDLIGLALYLASITLYSNIDEAHIFETLRTNGADAVVMLQRFNQRLAGCAATVHWGIRNDLGRGGNRYAPTHLGSYELNWEIIVDMFNWRGAGASHGWFTFEQMRLAIAGCVGGIADDGLNHDAVFLIGGAPVRVVINRTQKRLHTMYG